MIVTDERVARFVSEKIGRGLYPPYTCVGLEKDGRIVAGAVFNSYIGHDIELTIAGEEAITRGFLRELGRYVRDQIGCIRVSITTENPSVIRLACALGGKVEGVKRNGLGPGRDATLIGILREHWRL